MQHPWAKAYTDYEQYCKEAFSKNFADYIAYASHHLAQVRHQAELPSTADVVDMNLPFELRPNNYDGKKAVLLIHGFIASPYVMRAMGKFYLEKGYLVRAILLPGHGSSPGELLNAKLEHWQQAVDFGIKSLILEAEEIHLCGFSLGGTLADSASYRFIIKSLVKLAPAYGISRFSAFLPSLTNLTASRLLPFLQWSSISLDNNLAAYSCFPMHGAAQVYRAIRQLRDLMKYQAINTPSYIAASQEDATVKIAAIIQFMTKDTFPQTQMRLYSAKTIHNNDPKVTVIDSSKLMPNVLDMSHIAIPIAPDDSYYGKQGSFYGSDQSNYYFGEVHHRNVIHRPFKRLTYNPDFYGMLNHIDDFLIKL